jgi:hypothetical protein
MAVGGNTLKNEEYPFNLSAFNINDANYSSA